MVVAAFVLAVCAIVVAVGALIATIVAIRFARLSANAAETVEKGRRYGWRIEARNSDRPRRF